MKKIFIKYNPYKLETEITVDGSALAQNSKLREKTERGSRLQEWVEDLPDILIEEYNDIEFDITFHGTLLDYEDLTEVFVQAHEKDERIVVKLERIPAKETSDKEVLIEEVFEKIRKGPFDELRDPEILNAFQHAKSSDFEVCVVATMSAGKSTLINAMLGEKLMPSKQEACTAIITRIKDTDSEKWQAEVYDKENCLLETQSDLTLEIMERLNQTEKVSLIKANGNIPFVTAEDVSLVLIDTPGPNNSRDPEHRRVQSEFLGKSSKSLVLYIMEGTFGSDDDNALLQRVADSMSVGGKQSKDRFIFVVNKMDDRRKEDGQTEQTLARVRMYLKKHGIVNPNLFPAAALPALNIRLAEGGADLDEDTLDETELKVRKLNRNDDLHFENFSPLPASILKNMQHEVEKAIEENDSYKQALIHTGVVSIEAAIRQYVQKYAKTAKIKNIVDTFMHKLDEVGCFEETKKELAKNKGKNEEIVSQIDVITGKVSDLKTAQEFRSSVDKALKNIEGDLRTVEEKLIERFQNRITRKIRSYQGEELSPREAEDEIDRLNRFAAGLEPDFRNEMGDLVRDHLIKTSTALLNEYKRKLESLTDEIDPNLMGGIKIEPLKLMEGSVVTNQDIIVRKYVATKKVEDGKEWVKNYEKKWYKPWTWFQESGYWCTKYKDVEYVEVEKMVQEFFAPIQESLWSSSDHVKKYVSKQSKEIAGAFEKEFRRLDNVLNSKLQELKNYATDKENAEKRIAECEERLEWLESIKNKVEAILAI